MPQLGLPSKQQVTRSTSYSSPHPIAKLSAQFHSKLKSQFTRLGNRLSDSKSSPSSSPVPPGQPNQPQSLQASLPVQYSQAAQSNVTLTPDNASTSSSFMQFDSSPDAFLSGTPSTNNASAGPNRPIKIYGLTVSPNVQMVMFVCLELGIPFEIEKVDITKGEQKAEGYLATKNPFGRIPAMDDNGFVLFESQAICKHLVLRYGRASGSTLVPRSSDTLNYSRYEQACSIEAYSTHNQLASLAYERKFNPLFGTPVDEQKCQRLIGELEHMLAGYERILKTQKYLGGDTVTLADLFHVPWGYIVYYEQVIAVFDGYPSVARWWQDVSNRPAWRATLKAV